MTTAQTRELTNAQLMRYSRHIQMKSMDIDGQEKLFNSKVLVLGVGGLGCAVAQYLVTSGIGEITLIDDDVVDITNLQRQVLHGESDVGNTKCSSARHSLAALNSEVVIHTVEERLTGVEMAKAIASHDVVIDCCDNLATRNEVNQYCFKYSVPLVSGAAIRMEGQVAVFDMQPRSPCYHCLSQSFGEQVLTCIEAGILSPLVGVVGSTQAIEAIKLLANVGKPLSGKLMMIDAFNMDVQTFKLTKVPTCTVCS